MKIKVRSFGDLMRVLGKESIIELKNNAKIRDLLLKITQRIEGSSRGFLGRYNLELDLSILVNGRNIAALKKYETSLNDNDTVIILPKVTGG